jgi:hypothetical protein
MYYTVIPADLRKYPTKAKLKATLKKGEDIDFIIDGSSQHIGSWQLRDSPGIRLKVIWKTKQGHARTYAAVSWDTRGEAFRVL